MTRRMTETASQSSKLQLLIRRLVSRTNLLEEEMTQSIDLILEGKASEAAVASFLVALAMKGETADEIRFVIQCVKKHAIRISPRVNGRLIDTCGTGGDSIRSFNISTAAAIVAAAAGAIIAKHGNRSVSGICGSADFLEYVGMDLDSPPNKVQACIEETGIGFLFSPKFHPAMQNVAAARKTIGIRTIFNIVGPLSNPCTNLSGQVIGVFEPFLLEIVAEIMQRSPIEAMIVHAHDGFDELSNTCGNDIVWIDGKGYSKRIRLDPKSMNLHVARPEQLVVSSKEDSVRNTLQVIYGAGGREKEDAVVLNSSAALVIAKLASNFKEGIDLSRAAIRSGKAKDKLLQMIKYCGVTEKLETAEKTLLHV